MCTNVPYSMAAVIRARRRHRPIFSEGVDVLHVRMLHVLVTRNVFGAISLFMIIDLCTFVKLSLGSRFG